MKKMTKPLNFTIRFSKAERDQLEKEAAQDMRKLGEYIRKLLATHPDRKKK